MKIAVLSLCLACLLCVATSARAQNSLMSSGMGNSKISLELDDLFLQAQGRVAEPSSGGFSAPGYKIGAHGHFGSSYDLLISAGSSAFLLRPQWSPPPAEVFSLVEVVGAAATDYGTFYAGQFLLPWGLEGTEEEGQLWFPRSLFYEKGIFPLRDIGAGFRSAYDGAFVNVAVHNGLGAGLTNSTNRGFVTAQFGVRGPAHSALGFSLTEGRLVSPFVAQETKVRGVNTFFGFNIFGLEAQIEGSLIETRSDSIVSDSLAVHGDIEHPLTETINFVVRYEALNSNIRVNSNIISRFYVGGEIHSENNFSRFFIYAVKNNESQTEVPNDEIQIAWRISPKNIFF